MTGPEPLLRVVRGEPSDEEMAAVVTVVAAVSARVAAARGQTAPPQSAWGHPERAVRQPLWVGPGGWRRSALPG